MTYTLVGIKDGDDPELRMRGEDRKLVEMTWAASNYFERGNRIEAAREYRRMLEAFPGDPVATALLRECATDSDPPDAIYGRERRRT
jgi:adenylate cyclase